VGDDEIVTVRDIYNAVQRMNIRLTSIVEKVDNLAERAQEDRRQAEELEKEMDGLKIKVYAAIIALTLAGTILVLMEKVVYTGTA